MPAAAVDQDPAFTRGLFSFLSELAEHNDREWFKANRERYRSVVQEPALAFVEDAAPLLAELAPHLRADPRPTGGSLFRIHRDTRFSKDKSPYKTHVGIFFKHEAAADVHAPGWYVHLEPGNCMFGAGLFHPEPAVARRIRDAIAARPDEWRAAVAALAPRWELFGDALKRPPQGFDADHPLIDDLKRKDFAARSPFSQRVATGRGFLAEWEGRARETRPLLAFLCRALDLPF